jgi:hypothetical protein
MKRPSGLMKRVRPGLFLVMVLGLAGGAFAQTSVIVALNDVKEPDTESSGSSAKSKEAGFDSAAKNRTEDILSFIKELQELSDSLDDPSAEDMAKMRSSLPASWTLHTSDGDYVVSSAPIDKALEEGKSEDAQDWADHMLTQVSGYVEPRPSSNADARQELDKILGSSEFAAVHPPSAWALFRQRLSAWLERMLGKIFSGLGRYPITGEILFWTILLLAVSFLARLLFRFLVSRDRMQVLGEQEVVFTNRTWQEWIRLAKVAAARRDFREAVHSTYWAGIARLEDEAALPKDRSKTPREYLGLVDRPSQHELTARPTSYKEPLKELTTRLERVWYANRGAGPEDFAEALRQLKALGCQVE